MKIIATSKNGDTKEYRLDNGQIINQSEAIQMVTKKEIEGFNVFKTRYGTYTIRANRNTGNNIKNLQTF